MAKKILRVGGGIVGGLLGSSLFGKKSTPDPVAPTPVMPVADDVAVQAAKRRSLIKQLSRGGRSSTILTDSGDKLGG